MPARSLSSEGTRESTRGRRVSRFSVTSKIAETSKSVTSLWGVTLLDSAGTPVQPGADPKAASSRLEDLVGFRFGWERHVILGNAARNRVPPGERTPFRIEIPQARVVPFASL